MQLVGRKIDLPIGARFLYVASQYDLWDAVSLWFDVDPDVEREVRQFITHGTGHDVEDHEKYLGTVIVADGRLVWHVYETSVSWVDTMEEGHEGGAQVAAESEG